MDYETVTPEEFGASLRGFGINLLARDVRRTAHFAAEVFGLQVHRLSADFAILSQGAHVMQIHADGTYSANPLAGLLPETLPRGAGLELRLYDCDPDAAAARVDRAGGSILQPPVNKPHGLREAIILCPDGYAWVPSRPLTHAERKDMTT